jgi:uncharacterized ferredoxin-like protein
MAEESKAVQIVAELMALSARTAPKGRGLDSIAIRIAVDEDLKSSPWRCAVWERL